MKAPKEGDILKVVLQYLQIVRRWNVWRNNTGGAKIGKGFVRFGQKGSADLLGVVAPEGRALAVEGKMPGKKPTPAQESWLSAFRAAGGLALVVTGVDDLRRQLAENGYPE